MEADKEKLEQELRLLEAVEAATAWLDLDVLTMEDLDFIEAIQNKIKAGVHPDDLSEEEKQRINEITEKAIRYD